ncbi:CSEP0039 putative effector protein [Blumeria hordei DH14]|uniref:CSEP0039 putative effector protein n=1 Tax=Blumeria graminis f. sp. hordei (strain DH14) TaxID=546991 RepID=N1JL42_BLUG1|nr:CSEP0039 putative effector protein [Blumeria hordei DH14]
MFARYLVLAFLTTVAIAAPLNINLGAYSPALVVGDGEISFGGAEGEASAEGIFNTLQGSGTTGVAAGEAKGSAKGDGLDDTVKKAGGEKATKKVKAAAEKRAEKRDMAGFTAALNYADAALNKGPIIDLGTGGGGSGVGITVKPGVVA